MRRGAKLMLAGCAAALAAMVAPVGAGAASGTFSAAGPNAVPMTPPSGSAAIYPWDIAVAGLAGTTNDVNVTLFGVSHARDRDIDALLVGPNGAGNSLFMSDIGDGSAIAALNLTFDDGAAANAPIGSALASGTYRPTNGDGGDGDAFVLPAPAGAYAATLGALNGPSPNGTWSLYLSDDDATGADAGGSVQSWSLTITTTEPTPATPTPTTTTPKTKGTKKKKAKTKKAKPRRTGCRRFHGKRRLRCKCKRRRFRAHHRKKCRRARHHASRIARV